MCAEGELKRYIKRTTSASALVYDSSVRVHIHTRPLQCLQKGTHFVQDNVEDVCCHRRRRRCRRYARRLFRRNGKWYTKGVLFISSSFLHGPYVRTGKGWGERDWFYSYLHTQHVKRCARLKMRGRGKISKPLRHANEIPRIYTGGTGNKNK